MGRPRPGLASWHWCQWVAAAFILWIAAAMPWARADAPGQPAQSARDLRDLQRLADLLRAAAAGTVAHDGWTLSGGVPLPVTYEVINADSDSSLGPWVQLNWRHTLRPRLIADVSLIYTDYRDLPFTDSTASSAELEGRLNWTIADTQTYSSNIYSALSTSYNNNQSYRFNDIELNWSGGISFAWLLSDGSSVYVSPALSILQAVPNRPAGSEQNGRSYMSAGVTIGGTIPLSDRWALNGFASQWATRYAQYADETDVTQYLGVGLSRILNPYFSLDLNASYTLNLSTVASQQYQSLLIGITLNMNFGRGKE